MRVRLQERFSHAGKIVLEGVLRVGSFDHGAQGASMGLWVDVALLFIATEAIEDDGAQGE